MPGFSWLNKIDFPAVGDAAAAIGGIATSLMGPPENPALKAQMRALGALQDPAQIQNYARLYEEDIRRDLLKQLQTIFVQSRRDIARGGTGFNINPERRDEARYRAFLNAMAQAGEMSRGRATDMLSRVAGGYGSATIPYHLQNAAAGEMRMNAIDAIRKGIHGIGELVRRQQLETIGIGGYGTAGAGGRDPGMMGIPGGSNRQGWRVPSPTFAPNLFSARGGR